VARQEAVEALARAGLRNPVKVAVAVTATQAAAASGDDLQRPNKRQKKGEAPTAAAAADGGGGVLHQATPSSLRMEYIVCAIQEKLPQLVSAGHCCCVRHSPLCSGGVRFPPGTRTAW
jgi:hypothetical protein